LSYLSRLFAADLSISDLRNPRQWLVDWSLGRRTQAGAYVTQESALGISPYYACTRCIAEDVAKLPLITYRRVEKGKERAPKHWLYRLLHDAPNRRQTSFGFRELLTHRAVSWGGGFAEIERDSGNRALALWPVHPSRVTVIGEFGREDYVYQVSDNTGQKVNVKPENMLHIRGIGDERIGWSVARLGIESLGLTMAAQSFGAGFFGSSSSMSGVLTHPETMSPEGMERLRKEWSEMYSGPENAYKPAILEEGMKWERLGVPPEEGQFLESRQFQVEEIARWFRMPPHKIQHLLRSTFSNIEEQNIEYVVDTLTPWLIRWEQEIKMKLLSREEDVFAEHLILGLLRGDSVKRGDYYTKMFNIGAYSQNDILALENMNTIGPDGDTHYVPLNMIRSQDAAAGKQAEQPEATDPEEETPPRGRTPRPSEEDDDEDARARVHDALEPLIADAVGQLLRKEQNASERAEKRYAGKPEGFTRWLEEFYVLHRVTAEGTYRKLARAGATLLGKPAWDPAKQARFHVETSRSEVLRLFAEGKIGSGFAGFAEKHGQNLVRNALTEVFNGVHA